MGYLKTFVLGGVHPEENKLSASMPIQQLPLPKMVIIPLGQNLGSPSKSIVQKGDKVKVGQLIAEADGFISTNIHSSVSGTVLKIDKVIDTSGYKKQSIIIEISGDEWDENIDRSGKLETEIRFSSEEIIQKIKEAGIVGMGGATFPTYIKLMVPQGKKVDFLIINGVECEPFLTSDHRLMLEKGKEIIVGIQLLMLALKVDKAIIGIENNKPDAIKHLTELVKSVNNISVQALKVKYPQGGEKQLIKATVNREVPSGKLPFEVGCIVQNVGTAYAVYEAVQKNKPLFERVVTVTGKKIRKPSNFLVRLGTPIQELIIAAEGNPEEAAKIIGGGPMMGKALVSAEVPVVKGTSGILILEKEETKRKDVNNCIRCARCIYVCPMGLEPYLLEKLVINGNYDQLNKENVLDCIECGSCHYTCPSGRPLLDFIRNGKVRVNQLIRSRKN